MTKVIAFFLSWMIAAHAFAQSLAEQDVYKQAELLGSFNPYLVVAIAMVESKLNPTIRETDAKGQFFDDGGWGLMQLKLATARMLGFRDKPKNLLRWDVNLALAIKYLEQKVDRYGPQRVGYVAAAYNAGEAFICKSGVTGQNRPCKKGKFVNQGYVNAVLGNYRRLLRNQTLQNMKYDFNYDPLVLYSSKYQSNIPLARQYFQLK